MFSRILFSSTIIAGLAAPALAADFGGPAAFEPTQLASHGNVSGYVDVYFGFGSIDFDTGDYDQSVIGGAGRANIWLSPTVALQIDAWGDGANIEENSNSTSYSSFGIGGHLAWRDPSSYALGGMVTVGDAAFSRWATIAAEAQGYFGNLTLYGQLGYVNAIDGPLESEYDTSVWYLMGEARYFPMPNLMVAGHLGFENFDTTNCNSCEEMDGWRWGADIEFQPNGWPVAGFLAYQGSSREFEGVDWDEHVFLIGGKVLLGVDTLQGNNNNGATFVDYNPIYGDHRLRALPFIVD